MRLKKNNLKPNPVLMQNKSS